MKVYLLPDQSQRCQPLTVTRSLGECPVASRPFAAAVRDEIELAGLTLSTDEEAGGELMLYANDNAWLASTDLRRIAALESPLLLHSAKGCLLGYVADSPALPTAAPTVTVTDSMAVVYPWDLIAVNEILLGRLEASDLCGEVSAGATIDGFLALGEGSRVLAGTYVEGNVIVGRNCKVGPNCYLRGPTAIGDNCHVGQAVEIKCSILMNDVGMGHLSYAGDSIIGAGSNFGAGTITANFRHDGEVHRSMVDGKLVSTGRHKLGAIIGDDVHTGIHTSIYPGRKLWPHTSTRPGAVVQEDLMS